MVMALEGLKVSPVDRFLRGLGAGPMIPTTPVPPPMPPTPTLNPLSLVMAHPVWLAIGVLGGFWLAGSKKGQSLFKKKA